MAASSNAGKRWVEILRTLRQELPGEWSLRGGGLKTLLVREPIGWAIPWIGASKASSVRTHAGVAAALKPTLIWAMGVYGLDMTDVPRGPKSIQLGEQGDLDVARTFADHALTRFETLTPERYAEWAESSLQLLDGPRLPDDYILMAPGWRVVNDSGDPIKAAEGCIEWMHRRRRTADDAPPPGVAFYEGLIASYTDGGRERALAYLTENRDRQLAEQGYDTPS